MVTDNSIDMICIALLLGITIYLFTTGHQVIPDAVKDRYKDINTSSISYSLGLKTLDEQSVCDNITQPIKRLDCLGFKAIDK